MRRLEFWVLSTDKGVTKESIFKVYSCNLLKLESNNKYYFCSKYDYKEEIKVEMNVLDLSNAQEDFYNKVFGLYCESMKRATEISAEPIGSFVKGLSPEGPIYSIITKYSYGKNTSQSIFDFCAELFMRLLMAHVLTNGNKRTATVFLKLLLKMFGYYFKWTEGFFKNYSIHKDKIRHFTEQLTGQQNSDSIKNKEIKSEILSWIKHNICIDLGKLIK